ncbi:MAG: YeeE/YedE thiosulfate transporter family protein [Acidimicrobiia bacterium]
MNGYWPWWAGALGLATVAVGYWLVVGRTVGVSGAWDRVLHWRQERAVERLDAQFDEAAFLAALEAATAERFGGAGGDAAAGSAASGSGDRAIGSTATATAVASGADHPAGFGSGSGSDEVAPRPSAPRGPVPVVANAALLVSVFAGGLIASLLSGRFELRLDMGPDHAALVASGWKMWAVLFVGGVLVGFGTRLAGGCSSGHGLSGCSRLQPASIVATAVFFGTAVAVSFLLWDVL